MSEKEREEKREEKQDLSPDEPADVELFTSVRAGSLRFGRVPETKLTFEGEPAERSSSEVERENLPDEVEPGKTYRDATVRWRARTRIVHPTDSGEEPPG